MKTLIAFLLLTATGLAATPSFDGVIVTGTTGNVPTLTGTNTLTHKTLTSPVINSPTGIVKADVGLGNVSNTDTTNASNLSSGTTALARGGTGANLSATGGANQFVRQSSSGGALSVGAIVIGDLSGVTASIGAASKVVVYDSNGNIVTGPYANATAPTYGSGAGNVFFPDFQGVNWMSPVNGSVVAQIVNNYYHGGATGDSTQGSELFFSSNRHCFYFTDGFQMGSPAGHDGGYLYWNKFGAATGGDTIRRSRAQLWIGSVYYSGAAHDLIIGAQFIPKSAAAGSEALVFKSGATIGNNNAGATAGDLAGTTFAEMDLVGWDMEGTHPSFTTLTDGATITLTVDPHKVQQNATVTLGGARTLAFGGTLLAGMRGTLIVKQDATGSRTLTLPSGATTQETLGALTLTSTANAIDVLHWWYDGTNTFWRKELNYAAAPDADATAFFSRASISDGTQQTAINSLVVALKNAGVWSKLVAFYPFVGGSATPHSKNLISNTYNITWGGTVTHDANGVTGDGSTGYGNTGLAANAVGSTTSQFIYVYNRTAAPTDNTRFMGMSSAAGVRSGLAQIKPGGTAYVGVDGMNYAASATNFTNIGSDFRGHIAGNITDSANQALWFNSTTQSTALAATGRSIYNFYLLCRNDSGSGIDSPTNANLAAAAIGSSLTSGEWTAFKAAVDAYELALSRKVP